MAALFSKKRKGKAVAESSSEAPRFKTPFHEAHFKGKFSARKVLPELAIDYNDEILSPCAMQIKTRKWEKLTSPLPAVGHNLVKEFYANAWELDKAKRKPYTYTSMFYKFIYKTDLSSSLPFPSIIAALCLDAKVVPHKDDTMIPQEMPIAGEAMMSNETMYYPYQNTARQFREMEAQGVPVTIANLAIHRHREEEMNRERMWHNQTVQEAASQRAREGNKGKARKVVPDSDEEESEAMYSSPSEEW
ncbi:hypothetical protein PIB30_086105 [Stylosanthes scabra]|uniref:Uncharacterized protein n=1 Tax=Stylosanthes scabra TaxID=79078 RepID=A0ABU6ZRR1_9FABA|nr:hypothetical protein [Stylosanthes scabra]